MLAPGIQLMIKDNSSKERETPQDHPLEENPSKLVASSSFSQEDTEEEELLFLNHLLLETFWSLVHTLSTVFHWKESTQLMSFQLQLKFHSMESQSMLMTLSSRNQEPGLKVN